VRRVACARRGSGSARDGIDLAAGDGIVQVPRLDRVRVRSRSRSRRYMMIARVAVGEIDVVRTNLEDAVDVMRTSVVPALREQNGYQGMYLLLTEQGKALAVSFWKTDDAAEAGTETSRRLYEPEIEKFTAIYRSPPGRETYRLALVDTPRGGSSGRLDPSRVA
jgi:heme-degrading monooxygenase HmoA